jgi:MFS family permease
MTDTTQTEVARTLQRHDSKTRWTYIAMLSISLILSAIIFTDAMLLIGSVGIVIGGLWNQIVMGPLIIGSLWLASTWYARKRPWSLDGRDPTNPDDMRNLARLANAGYWFVTGFSLIAIAGQVYWVLLVFDVLQPPGGTLPDWWVARALMLGAGALMIFFGNISPTAPTPRVPEANPAVRMKYNRLTGWMYVVFGVLLWLAALFTPTGKLTDAIGGLGILLLLVMGVGYACYNHELKSRSAA